MFQHLVAIDRITHRRGGKPDRFDAAFVFGDLNRRAHKTGQFSHTSFGDRAGVIHLFG